MKVCSVEIHTISYAVIKEVVSVALSPVQIKVATVALIIFGILSASFGLAYFFCRTPFLSTSFVKRGSSRPTLKWVDAPVGGLTRLGGSRNNEQFIAEIKKNGAQLRCLILRDLVLDDVQFEEMLRCCPNLVHLEVRADQLTDNALEHLHKTKLTKVAFNRCLKLTNHALKYLQGMPLKKIRFNYCLKLTDSCLEYLKAMPLESVDFSECTYLTDLAFVHLKGLKNLNQVNFSCCFKLTDQALFHLRGMQLQSIDFSCCHGVTNQGIAYLKGMPLSKVVFMLCSKLTDAALEHLAGMQLTHVDFSHCVQLTDQGLKYLLGMPLKEAIFDGCPQILHPVKLLNLEA